MLPFRFRPCLWREFAGEAEDEKQLAAPTWCSFLCVVLDCVCHGRISILAMNEK